MRPIEFADKHLHPYKRKGDEIIPRLCPICKGGSRGKDTDTFAMNVDTGAYNCKRGTCGAQGSFRQLCERFHETPYDDSNYELRRPPKKSYKKPQTRPAPVASKVESYLSKRGFSKATWERRKVGEDGGNIVFPYYEDGELVLVKFRPAKKVQKGERKAWREEGGKPVFWGMDECDPALPLVICEGEMDALALDEAGIPNVVSVPSGAEDLTCVDNCWDWLERFTDVVIWPDNDDPGQEMCRKLIARLGEWRCRVVKSQYKDANEHLYHDGQESAMQAVVDAQEVPVAGLVSLANVKAFDLEQAERVRSSIGPINKIVGGFMTGQYSVWTGVNGSGKSTLLGQELLMAVDQGYPVCAYSGELPAALFRYWIDVQAAGRDNLERFVDPVTGSHSMRPNSERAKDIRSWYANKFYLYDVFGGVRVDNLFKVFGYAAMRYGCRVFLVDNLMALAPGGSDSDFYRKQSELVARIKEFAHKFEAHVHLVAHPRKTTGRLTKMDVAGSGDITNWADNVFSIHRLTPEDMDDGADYDAILDVFKSRFSGKQDHSVRMVFDNESKRFAWREDDAFLRHEFGWIEKSRRTKRHLQPVG